VQNWALLAAPQAAGRNRFALTECVMGPLPAFDDIAANSPSSLKSL
jgi:hypothetical protein